MGNDPKGPAGLDYHSKDLIAVALIAAAYFLAGKLALSMAVVHPSSTAVWPPSGLALAAFLILGPRVWPGIALGAFFVNVTTGGGVWTSGAIATGNTLEGLLGAYLVLRFANGARCFDRVPDTLKFAFLAGPVSAAIGATVGATTLVLGGLARWLDFKPIWLTWWLGDQTGILLVAPLVLLWSANYRLRWGWSRIGELVILLVSLAITGQIVFGSFVPRGYPMEYAAIPFLVWAALRFGPREAATISLLLAGIALRGTLHGFGPFAVSAKNDSLLLLQAFMSIVAVTTLTLAVLTAERLRADEQILNLAVTDPLTGLANYRKLIDVLDLEIKRFGRTGRPFSILLLDMDGLKAINDEFGHLVGSQALRRLSHILRVHCRDIDTAGRYGGDEFVLVIPETGRKQALQVAQRIQQRVEEDEERPAIAVSFGAAVYPRDGETRDELLEAADRALYQMKRRPIEEGRPASAGEGGA
jgi:diguanylate cyclase (GGDEF)-like protein